MTLDTLVREVLDEHLSLRIVGGVMSEKHDLFPFG
nr:MAG TPA: hypothetical protein [Caudoviricetes sp.]